MLESSMDFLRRVGCQVPDVNDDERRLVLEGTVGTGRLKVIIAKPSDVPTYVQYGAADIGIVGKDVLMEGKPEYGSCLYELADLGFGEGRIVLAAPFRAERGFNWRVPGIRVATKFPNTARDFFTGEGVNAEVIKVHGATELAPRVGLSDIILDIVSTGRTLKDNGLVEVFTVARISARLIANSAAMNFKGELVRSIVDGVTNGKEISV
jgi:ATP phosphoribosyltransferase